MALSFRLFTNGNGIVQGGVVGLSTLLERRLHIEPALLQWGVNLPLLIFGFIGLGKQEGMRSLLGSFLLPLMVLLTKGVPVVTHDLMLASIFGGLLSGAGLGLVLSGSGSVGGYSLLGRVISRRLPFNISSIIFGLDAATILGCVVLFGPERAMFGLISSFLMRRTIDSVLVGFSRSFVALIISEKHAEIRAEVLTKLDRGLTILPGKGGYSDADRPVLMVVLGHLEVPHLRRLVADVDAKAFVVMTDASEVLGEGFRRH